MSVQTCDRLCNSSVILGEGAVWWRKGHPVFGKSPDLLFSSAKKKVYFSEEAQKKALRNKKAESAGLQSEICRLEKKD
jgi:hypothetical protein